MNAWFVVNPHAGSVRSRDLTTAIRRQLSGREATISGELPEVGSASRLVVAVGGDGTINRVINGCDPARLRLGILPRGSANDLGAELGIPSEFRKAWSVLESGATEAIDLLSVNGSRFATCGGFGLASAVAQRANLWKAQPGWRGPATRRLGPLVYVLAALRELERPLETATLATIRAGRLTRRVRLGAALVSNQPRFGRWFVASPEASNRDGLIHFRGIAATASRARLLRLFAQMLRGGACEGPSTFEMRVRSLTIETETEVSFFGDGERLAHGRRFRIEVLPRALRVVTARRAAPLAEAA